jgi:putative copper export protein/mono/diheme cytochrome c family protein
MTGADIAAALLRGLDVASLVFWFGTLLFVAAVLPTAPGPASLRRGLLRLARVGALAGFLTAAVWLVLQTAQIAGADSVAATAHALPAVALHTQFGHWLLARVALLVGALALPRSAGLAIPLVLAGAALGMQPMLGHAGAIGGAAGMELIGSEALHVLAAGAWLGGLLPLCIAVARLPHPVAASACRSFTPIGLASVLILGGTAVVQAATFMGGLPGLLGTSYGRIALLKLTLFLLLLALAMLNRFWLTERLVAGSRRHIRLSIAGEIALGLCVVLAGGVLASRTPGTHEQAVWPLPWQPSSASFVDPGTRRSLVVASLATAGGVGLFAVAALWRRWRWPALMAGVAIELWTIPRLGLLFVPAYPTSFFTSPTEFAATAIVHGQRLFAANCVVCHGPDGRGDGPAAASVPLRPADLTAEHLRLHGEGDLYWFISHGFTAPNGAATMPGFAAVVSSEGIWDLIDYLHAHNAGAAMRATGRWPQPVPIPQFDAQCADGRYVDLHDWRGRGLRLIAVSDDENAEQGLLGDIPATTILVARRAVRRPGGACIAAEPELWTALAIILGVPPDGLAGTQVLADQNGWLRAVWHDGDPAGLAAAFRDILAHPLPVVAPAAHAHH